ncbi:S9 family peptidase [Saccharopolyspora rhizosphaerae]|uniref:S9 family peptidase n=1 Tax=Saccharopolyspora rhizosphaerae TaxID=2492662 RepID=A0A426JNZ2_9PSEU|nr:prolyl oligopeptidase family serine peptidase [Saccharopolyspora rhizosphaerae]RRO14760.1 S9 family peptidase [Saccharopolyspora rhizosphaerae]
MSKASLGYGSWPTPVTSELVTRAATGFGSVAAYDAPGGSGIVWSESRPDEGGRTQLVRLTSDGVRCELLPAEANARTAVHEYGGGAWWLHPGDPESVWYVDWADQRVRLQRRDGEAVALTPEPEVPRGDRYADGDVAHSGRFVVAVREHHPSAGCPAREVRNEVVRLDAYAASTPEVLVSGHDFVAAPRLSTDDSRLAWISWEHPSMPWDDTVLRVRDLATGAEEVVAGGPGESVSEPQWHPDGSLTFLSDRTGWWNLYRWRPGAAVEALVEVDAEIGVPGWQLGGSRYAVLPDGRIVFAAVRDGFDRLAVRETTGEITELDLPFSVFRSVRPDASGTVVFIAGSPAEEFGVHRVVPSPEATAQTARAPRDLGLDRELFARPESFAFPSVDAGGAPRTGHALYYPPTGTHTAPEGELPPLLVTIHGGPTSMAQPVLNVGVQYWTSRGVGVVDVNYGGSTGYGRAYREQLHGAWGVVDVADCTAAARALAEAGRVDPDRMAIRGGSAGGFTTLAALARPDTPFSAGADHFGVADLEALVQETHKFESQYLHRLIGQYPQDRETFVQRSPITHVDQLRTPLVVLQGGEDVVVPPNQSELIVEAVRERGVPVAYLLFPDEQHGFRRTENIRRALDAELYFYSRVFGFDLPEDEGIAPIEIDNLDQS